MGERSQTVPGEKKKETKKKRKAGPTLFATLILALFSSSFVSIVA